MNSDVKTEVISSSPDLTILGLFFQADPFVKGVMFLLIFASIWCWAIIINKYALLRNERKLSMEFEDIFWSGVNLDELYQEYSENINNSQVRVFISGMREFNKINQRQTLSGAKLKDSIIGRCAVTVKVDEPSTIFSFTTATDAATLLTKRI